jgi:hypothetical protein
LGQIQMFFCAFDHWKLWDMVRYCLYYERTYIMKQEKVILLFLRVPWRMPSILKSLCRTAVPSKIYQMSRTSRMNCFPNTRFHRTSYQQFFFCEELVIQSLFWNLSWLR